MHELALVQRMRRARAARSAALAGVALLAGVVALFPVAAVVCAVALTIAAAAVATRDRRVRVGFGTVSAPLAAVAGVGAVVAGTGTLVAVAVWPALALPIAAAAALAALAWRAPAWGLVAAILLFGFEGSVKILVGFRDAPLPAGNRAIGAALLDFALFGAALVLVFRDRLRTPRLLWSGATRAERVVLALLVAWLGLSVLQIALGGDLGRGMEGFRLFQAYAFVALAAAVAVARPAAAARAATVVLGVGFVVGLYAAARVVLGPSAAEREFASSIRSVIAYGGQLRATGSFSSAVGLSSFLTPVVVFAIVTGYFSPRLRLRAWVVAALALVGIVGSYGRAPLVAVALGLLFALAVTFAAGDLSLRRKLLAVALVAAVLGGTYAGVWAVSGSNDALRERAEGLLNPLSDESVELRFETWEEAVGDSVGTPLGHGVGTAGSASAPERRDYRTTDNSFVKVFFEQGFPGLLLFLAGVLGTVAVVAARLRRLSGEARAVGVAALAGFVGFLGLAVTGEYVEQPGKVAAWALFGVALAYAFGLAGGERRSGSAGAEPPARRG